MKQLLSLVLALALLAGLTGCRAPEPPAPVTTAPTTPEPSTAPPTIPPTTQPTTQPTTEPEETEPAVVLPEPEDEDFVRILDYIPTAREALAYATVDNFTGCRIYDFTEAYLRYGTVKKLIQVSGELENLGLGLLIWDGFRPVSAQAKLWEICPDPTFVSHPVTGKRAHCRGNTLDVTLYDLETGLPLAMPTGFDNFTAYADRDYSDCSQAAAENARLLENTMEKYGFTPYFSEWWHFSDTQDYPVEEYFYPGVPQVWTAGFADFVSLRRDPAPEGEILATISCGAEMTLLGWSGKYAWVTYEGQAGYVLSSYLLPGQDMDLRTVVPTEDYTYDQMQQDLEALAGQYPDRVRLGSIGTSELGRDIPVLRLGNETARYHVLVQGAIHGREHLTAWLLVALADYWLDHDLESYGDVCFHLIPMVNPDGVAISQTGFLSDEQNQIYLRDLEQEFTTAEAAEYAALWKANGLGIDLNRNFPAGWEAMEDRLEPSSQLYQGDAPFSATEARALRDYTLQYDFDVTVSYHATGSMIFYEYGDNTEANARSQALAQAISQVSGYDLVGSVGVDGAGYKDWAIDVLGIPSVTVEIGCEEAPLALREIPSIFLRNYRVLAAIARWLQI